MNLNDHGVTYSLNCSFQLIYEIDAQIHHIISNPNIFKFENDSIRFKHWLIKVIKFEVHSSLEDQLNSSNYISALDTHIINF